MKDKKMLTFRAYQPPSLDTVLLEAQQAAIGLIVDDFYSMAPKYRTKARLKDMLSRTPRRPPAEH